MQILFGKSSAESDERDRKEQGDVWDGKGVGLVAECEWKYNSSRSRAKGINILKTVVSIKKDFGNFNPWKWEKKPDAKVSVYK